MISIDIVFNRLPEIAVRLPGAVDAELDTSAHNIEAGIKIGMAAEKSGVEYARGSSNPHQASKPGEYPAVDYGDLIASVKTRRAGPLDYYVEESMEYAPILEFNLDRAHMVPEALKEGPLLIERLRHLEAQL